MKQTTSITARRTRRIDAADVQQGCWKNALLHNTTIFNMHRPFTVFYNICIMRNQNNGNTIPIKLLKKIHYNSRVF